MWELAHLKDGTHLSDPDLCIHNENTMLMPCINSLGCLWWCNCVMDTALFGPLSINWALFKCHSLPEYCCWSCLSVHDCSVPIFWWLLSAGQCAMSQSSKNLQLVSWTWVLCTQKSATVPGSQFNRAPLGCGRMRNSHHRCAPNKSAPCDANMSISCQGVPNKVAVSVNNQNTHLWMNMFQTRQIDR